ncbi:apoptosis-inducing factor 1, mitochondrial [Halyomorpha halys]|uniref:apoptosis-inducing factor 1, mitochondrial n=1 Tax=Halyomorpha halys TaxID=286706 RepID=UPI0006D502A9|nr:apoptosis-inducing factor 1, mitochondrial-like [Halyomorpha halys]
MYSLVRLIAYQNPWNIVNRRRIFTYHHFDNDQNRIKRTYCSKKDDIVDKLDNLEQKIQTIVRKKTIDCLEAKCQQPDTSLPDCHVHETTVDPGRRHQVHSIPPTCPPLPNESDTCIRPYVNPCPPHPSKECDPCTRPVHPCREPCKKPKYEEYPDKKIMELDLKMMRILFALTTLLAAFVLYKVYIGKDGGAETILTKVGKHRRTEKPRLPQKDPQYTIELPSAAPYLIVGGGPAAYSAMKKLIELDPEAKILMINKEHYYPYDRTPLNTEMIHSDPSLSKELNYTPRGSTSTKDHRSIFFEHQEFYTPILHFEKSLSEPGHAVSIARGWEVIKIDGYKKVAYIDGGKTITFKKCILATGSSPRNLRVFTENSDDVKKRVSTFTTVYDFQLLDEIIDSYKGNLTIAIVGGGLNGTELACALQRKGVRVIQIFEENNNMGRLLPQYLAQWLSKRVVNLGVTILPQTNVLDALIWKGGEHDGNIALYVNSNQSKKNYLVFADHVLVSIGNLPNTDIAEPSGFEVDEERGGFLVNTELQVREDIYAAGDCISYYDSVYGRRHFEHYEHAMETGKTAAENVMSKSKMYDYQTLIWSDLLSDLGYEAVGIIDSSLPTVGIYYVGDKTEKIKGAPVTGNYSAGGEEAKLVLEEFNKGIVFYLNQKETIVGILTWNIYNRAPMLRKILERAKHYKDCDDLARLMHIHS